MAATSAAIAARNGTNSTARSRSGGCSTSGSSWCESTLVSPCPGKCLPQAATPAACSASMMHAPSRDDVGRGLGQRAIADHRVLRVGVDVEHRREVERDADGAQLGGQRPGEARGERLVADAPSVAIGGHSVNGVFSRATRPPSWSTLTQSGRSRASARASTASSATCSGRLDVAREQDDAAEVELARQRAQSRRES